MLTTFAMGGRRSSSLQTVFCPAQVHDSLCNLTGLTALSLRHCHLTAVSPSISQLKNLISLDLSHNKLPQCVQMR